METPGLTTVEVILGSSSVTMAKEQYDFSFGSLIADVGGVLGLFIGFNFLQLCELALTWCKKSYVFCRKLNLH